MKTVILTPKPKREQESIYLEDIENFTYYNDCAFVLVVDNRFVLLNNDIGKFQWFDVEEFMIISEEFEIIKYAIDFLRQELYEGIESIKIFDWSEFDFSKVGA